MMMITIQDQQITAVIVNRKENLLKKGGGYHLDLLVVAIGIIVNSLLGIPWYNSIHLGKLSNFHEENIVKVILLGTWPAQSCL